MSSNCKRKIYKNKRHIDNKPLSEEDLKQYDYFTLFYDIFLDRKNEYLVIVGPPLLNFKRLFPLIILFNNKQLILNQTIDFNHLSYILKYKVNEINTVNQVKVILKNKLEKNFVINKNTFEFNGKILITKQKNNNLIWINDWIKHYQNLGVENIIIFDNNSKNQKELMEKYNKNNNILIIPYNFKFGTINCHQNKFMQVACLNNALYRFCDNNWILNFDIDELLNINSQSLKNITKKKSFNYYFNQLHIPVTNNLSENYSFDYFTKSKNTILKGGPKYIVHSDNCYYLDVHTFKSKCQSIDMTSLFNIFFYHYQGITTNWKKYTNRLDISNNSDLINIYKFNNIITLNSIKNRVNNLLLLYYK